MENHFKSTGPFMKSSGTESENRAHELPETFGAARNPNYDTRLNLH